MPSKTQYAHTCLPEMQGADRQCLACTQQVYYDCLSHGRGLDVDMPDAERYSWTTDKPLPHAKEPAQEYSVDVAAEVFRKHNVNLEFEVMTLRALCGNRNNVPNKNTGAIKFKAIEALQTLRREFFTGPGLPPASTGPGKNGVVPAGRIPKDDWTGTE